MRLVTAFRDGHDPRLDLVGDVRDHLHRVAEVLTTAFFRDHLGVDLTGGHVGRSGEVAVEEPFVVADVQIGLGAVVGDEHLAVLERVHRAWIDIEVGIQLLHRDPESTSGEKLAQAGGGEPLTQRGGDASGDKDVLGCPRLKSHGLPPYRTAPGALGSLA